jgi:hypothetical protein
MALGYLAVQAGGISWADDVVVLRERIAAFARARELTLLEVHVDGDMVPGRAHRPGLDALFAAVRVRAGAVVIVPTGAHLSPHRQVRAAIEATLLAMGATVIAIGLDGSGSGVGQEIRRGWHEGAGRADPTPSDGVGESRLRPGTGVGVLSRPAINRASRVAGKPESVGHQPLADRKLG